MCRYITMIVWFILLIVAYDFGLGAVGQGGFLMMNNFVMQNIQLVQYVVLAAALWSSYLYIRTLQNHCGYCGKRSCKCHK